MYTCRICGELIEKLALVGPHYQTIHYNSHSSLGKELKRKNEEGYNLNPKKCRVCGTSLSYDDAQRKKVFCSSLCRRKEISDRENHNKSPINPGVYFKYTGVCLRCDVSFVSNSKNLYCSTQCSSLSRKEATIAMFLEHGGTTSSSGDLNNKNTIKEYVLEQQNGLCAICGNPPIWMNSPIMFILDHIDGNASNNKRDNFRIICPNCDSQTSTYKGRNFGKGRRSKGFSANKGL